MTWNLKRAMHRFGESFRRCFSEGPQRIEWRGKRGYLVSEQDYRRLSDHSPSLVEFLMSWRDTSGLDLTRSRETMRELGD